MVFDAKTVSMLVKETWRTLYMVGLSSLISYLNRHPSSAWRWL